MLRITRLLALGLMAVGIAIMAMGTIATMKASEGLRSLDAVYEAQNVTLSYNDDGVLVDRGTPEGAEAIMDLLENDWAYPVVQADLDPNDPVVNTPSELMFQYATISYHVLHGTQTVTLTEPAEYEGETFAAGTYDFEVDGRYWTDFNRSHPLEGPARTQAWEGAHGLLASISSGVAADSAAGFAHFVGWKTIITGFAFALGGAGLFALSLTKKDEYETKITREKEMATTA